MFAFQNFVVEVKWQDLMPDCDPSKEEIVCGKFQILNSKETMLHRFEAYHFFCHQYSASQFDIVVG